MKNIRPLPKPYFNTNDKIGIRRIAQLRVGLSDLRAHRYNHHFINCPSASCVCAQGDETTEHFLLGCNRFLSQRSTLLSSLANISPVIDFSDHHHHCSTLVETMDFTMLRQTSRSIITLPRSCSVMPVSLEITAGYERERPLL